RFLARADPRCRAERVVLGQPPRRTGRPGGWQRQLHRGGAALLLRACAGSRSPLDEGDLSFRVTINPPHPEPSHEATASAHRPLSTSFMEMVWRMLCSIVM